MKFLGLLFLLCSCCAAFAAGDRGGSKSWEDYVEILETPLKAQQGRLGRFGPSETFENSSGKRTIYFPSEGVSLVLLRDKVHEIHFHVEPGKKVSQRQFEGTLPLVPAGATWHNYTQKEAVASLGQPQSVDRQRAYTVLSYPHKNVIVMLFFLESRFAGIAIKKSEPVDASTPSPPATIRVNPPPHWSAHANRAGKNGTTVPTYSLRVVTG
jgi:hypothetical protein